MSKKLWGVVVGQPTPAHGDSESIRLGYAPHLADNIGRWVVAGPADAVGPNGETLYYTRQAARDAAKYHAARNGFWLYHAKFFSEKP